MPASRVIVAQTSSSLEPAQEPPAGVAEPSRQTRNQEAIAKARDALARRERARGPEHPAVILRNPATAHPYYWAPFILIGAR